MKEHDWTADEETGLANSSKQFHELVEMVRQTIINDAHSLLIGDARHTARLIMAKLAHTYGMAPTPKD